MHVKSKRCVGKERVVIFSSTARQGSSGKSKHGDCAFVQSCFTMHKQSSRKSRGSDQDAAWRESCCIATMRTLPAWHSTFWKALRYESPIGSAVETSDHETSCFWWRNTACTAIYNCCYCCYGITRTPKGSLWSQWLWSSENMQWKWFEKKFKVGRRNEECFKTFQETFLS